MQPEIAKLARRTNKAKGMTLEFRKATKALENWGVRASIQPKSREDKGDREGILHTHPIP